MLDFSDVRKSNHWESTPRIRKHFIEYERFYSYKLLELIRQLGWVDPTASRGVHGMVTGPVFQVIDKLIPAVDLSPIDEEVNKILSPILGVDCPKITAVTRSTHQVQKFIVGANIYEILTMCRDRSDIGDTTIDSLGYLEQTPRWHKSKRLEHLHKHAKDCDLSKDVDSCDVGDIADALTSLYKKELILLNRKIYEHLCAIINTHLSTYKLKDKDIPSHIRTNCKEVLKLSDNECDIVEVAYLIEFLVPGISSKDDPQYSKMSPYTIMYSGYLRKYLDRSTIAKDTFIYGNRYQNMAEYAGSYHNTLINFVTHAFCFSVNNNQTYSEDIESVISDSSDTTKESDVCGIHLFKKIQNILECKTVEKAREKAYINSAKKIFDVNESQLDKKTIKDLKSHLTSSGDNPRHVLLYGNPGTGKTDFIKSLIADIPGAILLSGNDTSSFGQQESRDDACADWSFVGTKAHFTTLGENVFLLVDEAELLFESRIPYLSSTSGSSVKTKEYINSFLERPNLKIIWITNHIWQIDSAIKRRFTYVVKFDEHKPKQLKRIFANILKKNKIKPNEKLISDVVDRYPKVSIGIISDAIKAFKHLPKKEMYASIENKIQQQLTVLNYGDDVKPEPLKDDTDRPYSLDGVSLAKSSTTPDKLLGDLKKLSKRLEESKTSIKGRSNILFYGPPGTGKSELAKHIAKELDKKVLFKKCSDIVSKWVGESEKNIKAAFEEAKSEDMVLVFDEADTFLFPRDGGNRSWEISQTNEFLTQLENSEVICICTTNGFSRMDNAATRRFSFKLEFDYSTDESKVALFNTILKPLTKSKLSDNETSELKSIKSLTPGDFSTVKSLVWLEDEVSNRQTLDLLKEEVKHKKDKENVGNSIGFLH